MSLNRLRKSKIVYARYGIYLLYLAFFCIFASAKQKLWNIGSEVS
nr:MAG TPA: hypothetical protein [Bacteriophage sp.]DAG56253.1 MAG TPA: hypothetical protein [Caudoviricetes sp.]DAH35528.1 MAG TPA: hypothetical protein [Caudoviricetes sp.]